LRRGDAPDDALEPLAQAAAQDAWTAAQTLVGTPPNTVARLSDAALDALAQAAAQEAERAATALAAMTEVMATDDPVGREGVGRGVAALIAVPDGVAPDDLIAWAQEAPPEALAHERVRAALQDRVRADEDAAPPLVAILERRLPPPDDIPPPVFARRSRS
ncbi:hypothetical protein, partial [Roseiflexus castenholzii]|uniref:hypothetical protein n=1 Tax=Roseiflexus castenholzii TaxID=120962 RepID=UPI003C7C8DB9